MPSQHKHGVISIEFILISLVSGFWPLGSDSRLFSNPFFMPIIYRGRLGSK